VSETGFEFTSRYEALGMPLPDPASVCRGGCEGIGLYPVKRGEWTEAERAAWDAAELENPNEPGDEWHFIRCQTCGGTGLKP
jgi:hypothetical protein